MSRGVLGKNNWALVLLILVGVVLGGLIGKLCAGVPALSWLSYGQSFGFVNPMVLDLGILVLTFGFTVDITVAGILGIVIAIIIYRLFPKAATSMPEPHLHGFHHSQVPLPHYS